MRLVPSRVLAASARLRAAAPPARTVALALCAALLLALAVPAAPAQAQPVHNRLYAGLLARHVRGGLVDYAGLKAEEFLLDDYLDILQEVRPEDLDRAERFAYWINVYNAFTLKLVLGDYPEVKSIKEIGGFFRSPWRIELIHVAGRKLTLDDVEKAILIPEFADPRVHFAINCASMSCPPLAVEPYEGARLDAQLEARARAFVNSPAGCRLEGRTLWLSRIFKWYGGDFGPDVVAWVRSRAEGELARGLDALEGRPEVRWMEYDWSLNGR